MGTTKTMTKGGGGRSSEFSPEGTARLRALFRELVKRSGGNVTAAAKLIGYTQPAGDAWVHGRNGFSRAAAESLCKEMGVGLEDVLAGVARPVPAGFVAELEAPACPDPNLTLVLDYWHDRPERQWPRMVQLAAIGMAQEGHRHDKAGWERELDALAVTLARHIHGKKG